MKSRLILLLVLGLTFPKVILSCHDGCTKKGDRHIVGGWYGFLGLVTEPSTNLIMLRWILIFLVIALIAAVLGFGGIAAGAASIAQIIFYIFLVLLVISLVMHLLKRT